MQSNRKTTRTIEYDLGETVQLRDLRQIVKDTEGVSEDAAIRINAGDSQRDGAWNKISIIESS